MTTNGGSPSGSISASFKRLSASAAQLNEASNELGTSIEALDAILKTLGLGVAGWLNIAKGGDPDGSGYYWQHDLGYAKVGSKWGIALRSIKGHEQDPEGDDVEQWPFADAPRAIRIQAV